MEVWIHLMALLLTPNDFVLLGRTFRKTDVFGGLCSVGAMMLFPGDLWRSVQLDATVLSSDVCAVW